MIPYFINKSELDIYNSDRVLNRYPTLTEFDASGRTKKINLPKTKKEQVETSITYTYNDPYEVIETHSIGRSKRTIKNELLGKSYVNYNGYDLAVDSTALENTKMNAFGNYDKAHKIQKLINKLKKAME